MRGLLPTLALLVCGCDLGLDPSMVDAGGGGADPTSVSSATGRGGDDLAATATSGSTTGAGGAGGAPGTGGAGGAGGADAWTPCAPPDTFDTFVVSSDQDAWIPTGSVTAPGAGDRVVRMVAGSPSPQLQQTTPSTLDGCFASIVLEENGGARQYLSFECASGRIEFGVDEGTGEATVHVIGFPSAEPDPVPVAGDLKESTIRARFPTFPSDMVFEYRPRQSTAFETLFTLPRPFWATSCVVGFGADSIASSAEFDDFCADAP